MFEVIAIGSPLTKRRWLFKKVTYFPVKMRATTAMTCQVLARSFQGHGNYTTQTYQIDISEGEVITISSTADMLEVGDKRSLETLVGQGYLGGYRRLVATSG
jgi:hypothetical protein